MKGSFRHQTTDSKHGEPQQEGDLPIAGTSTPASVDREVKGSFRHHATDVYHGEPQQEGDLPIAGTLYLCSKISFWTKLSPGNGGYWVTQLWHALSILIKGKWVCTFFHVERLKWCSKKKS